MLSTKMLFKDNIADLKSAKEILSFLIVENVLLATSFPDVFTAYMMYLTVPVTIARAERSKLIKNFLQSSMSQKRLSGLSLLSVENEQAKNLNLEKLSNSLLVQKLYGKISNPHPPANKLLNLHTYGI